MLGAAALLGACALEREPGGVLLVAQRGEWQPAVEWPGYAGFAAAATEMLFDRLVRDRGELALARSISPEPDARVWTVVLRDDARFASGRPITAADAVASITAQLPATTLTATVVDASTLRLELPEPRLEIPRELTQVAVARADQAAARGPLPIADIDASGSWQVARVQAPDLVLVPNPHGIRAQIDGIVLRAFGSQRSVFAAAVAGEVDYLSLSNTVRDTDFLEDHAPVRFTSAGDRRLGALRFNCRNPKLADLRVRRAIGLAVDREAIVARFVSRKGRAVRGFDAAPPVFDPRAAAALLDEAGWRTGADGVRARDGVRLELEILMPPFFSEMLDVAQAAAADLEAVGIAARVEARSVKEVQSRRAAGEFELTFTWYASGPRGGDALRAFRPSGPATGLFAGSWDFGRCAAPHAGWLAMFDLGEAEAGRAGLVASTLLDPPAVYLFEVDAVFVLHERFDFGPLPRPFASWAPGFVLRRGEALPRDRLSFWLGGE